MGWVRGQTGEQKRKEKQSKDSPGLRGLGRAGCRDPHLPGCGAGVGAARAQTRRRALGVSAELEACVEVLGGLREIRGVL